MRYRFKNHLTVKQNKQKKNSMGLFKMAFVKMLWNQIAGKDMVEAGTLKIFSNSNSDELTWIIIIKFLISTFKDYSHFLAAPFDFMTFSQRSF